MRGWFAIALFLALAGFAASGSESRFRLKSHTWKHRLLLVFAPSPNHPASLQQRSFFEQTAAGFRERELLYVEAIPGTASTVRNQRVDAEAQAALRKEFDVDEGSFAVLLVGKDGGVKLRRGRAVASDELFALIDSMPMRQQELQRKGGGRP